MFEHTSPLGGWLHSQRRYLVGGLTQIVALNVLRVAGLPGGSFVVLCGRTFPILL